MAQVILKDLNKEFDGLHVVKDFNIVIEDKEFIVLVGPSGCGKTTTLRMIAGLEDITSGEITIGGRVVNDLAPKHRDIAMVFQNYALYPHMKVFENIAFGLRMRRFARPEIKRRVHKAAEILGIMDLLDRKPRQLSGGQRQRVALGRALVRDPKVFLFDEPLSNLDAKLRVQMRAEIKRLHRRLEATAVYVTHDQVEALTLGDRIVVMRDGVIQQIGEPMSVYSKPANKFVAGFIGSPAMNFADLTITGSGDSLWAMGPGMRIAVPAARIPGLRPRIGRVVTLGIRPEHLRLATEAATDDSGFDAVVDIVEPLGSELLVEVNAGSVAFTARVDPKARLRPSQPVRVLMDSEQLHFFDSDTQAAL